MLGKWLKSEVSGYKRDIEISWDYFFAGWRLNRHFSATITSADSRAETVPGIGGWDNMRSQFIFYIHPPHRRHRCTGHNKLMTIWYSEVSLKDIKKMVQIRSDPSCSWYCVGPRLWLRLLSQLLSFATKNKCSTCRPLWVSCHVLAASVQFFRSELTVCKTSWIWWLVLTEAPLITWQLIAIMGTNTDSNVKFHLNQGS